ncbi:hypothetical protein NW768_010792 [Fusarium equiseti]|uniref:C2H2-type domain-containing protein n=1 Tax=Fusarium equiseti TaxID=61235 RepID=A0ABQ8QZE5_FUSEQ|nr:hypothetical protein NW768_010792 [Fusarium equiseti]
MRGDKHSRPNNSFPCVIADQYPDHPYCNKSFPTIEKHNEHLKRCHSLEFWCSKCLHKFNCSLPAGPLRLAKKEHDEKQCPGKPSRETQQLRNDTWLMTPDQYRRFKGRQWKKTGVSDKLLKESVSETSWRKIRETLFPGSEAAAMRKESEPAASRQTSEDIWGVQRVMDKVNNRSPGVMSQLRTDFPVPSADSMQPAWLNAFPTSLPTDESQLSIIFSEETHFETHPSSRVWSHSGGDEQHQLYRAEPDRPPTFDPSFLQLPGEREGHQASELAMSGECALDPIPPELLLQVGTGAPLTGNKRQMRSKRV